MNSKFWYYGLLAVVVLVNGCSEKTNKAQADKKTINLERNIVKSQSNIVKLETSKGNIVIELNEQAAPVTVKNFLGYVEAGFYDGTIFHRVIPGFMIQGGGFTEQMARKKTLNPIINEAKNGPSNMRGTVAMARTSDPDSATSQFFINHSDNDFLNYIDENKAGYAAFGKVIEGMDVVDAIAAVETTTRNGMDDVPDEPVIIISAKVVPE
ncbi:MAG: peptidyl-prolyl cis-trans isomerase [Sedimentisphaerales bacterium]|nr:peptidyl-prolyl cis-trans isomerase [Sedimentisphaerales bacterium]